MTRAIDERNIERYLLGELPNEESSRLEEEFFIDDESFAELEAVEMAMIDSYIQDRMSLAQRSRFESGYLSTPERREKVLLARTFHNELESLQPTVPETTEKEGWIAGLFSGWNLSLPLMRYAGAMAVILLTLSTAWLLYDGWRVRNELLVARNSEAALNEKLAQREIELNDRLAEQSGENSESLSALENEISDLKRQLDESRHRAADTTEPATPVVATVFLTAGRGPVGMVTRVELKRDVKVLSIKIPVDASENDRFSVEVSRGDKVIIRIAEVKSAARSGSRVVSLSVPTRSLNDGRYDLALRGSDGKEIRRAFEVSHK
jgi:hypothetical protein